MTSWYHSVYTVLLSIGISDRLVWFAFFKHWKLRLIVWLTHGKCLNVQVQHRQEVKFERYVQLLRFSLTLKPVNLRPQFRCCFWTIEIYVEIKFQLDATADFYCRSYCLLNMFRAPLCPSSGAREYYTSGCCLSYLVLGCRYGVELRVVCLVCGLHNTV